MKTLNCTKFNYSVWFLYGLIIIGFLGRTGISKAAEDTWTYIADMSVVRSFSGGGVIDESIYIIGGAPSNSSLTSTVEMYDPVVGTWTKMANMPSARGGHATCTLDGKIYAFGGNSPDVWSMGKKNVYVYDPQIDTWTQKSDMPYANASCGIAVVDGTIYLIGGMLSPSSPPIATVMAYDPVAESWTQKADIPTARGGLSACVVDRKIYAIGGTTDNWRSFSYKNVEVYDPSTDSWTRKSDMPTERWGLGTCEVNGKIYAIGGWSGSDACTIDEAYDPITDTWTTKSPLQQKRNGAFVCSIGDRIYAIGGAYAVPSPGFLSTAEEYDTGLSVPSPDFNGDGIADIKDLLRLIQSWGQDDPLIDIAPLPFGDEVVDALDLERLMSYWGQEVDDPTLIVHWALDETQGDIAYDSAGENDAVIIGAPVWKPEEGKIGGALEFDGVDDRVIAQYGLNPADQSFSVFAWIKGGGSGQVAISQLTGANWLVADPTYGCLMTELCGSGGNTTPLMSEMVITDGAWHRIGLVWDGLNRALYLDDILVAEDTQQGLENCLDVFNIGCGMNSDAKTFWSGLIDEIRIYNRAVRP